MEKPSLSLDSLTYLAAFLQGVGFLETIPPDFDSKGFLTDWLRGVLNVDRIERGRISCFLSVKPCISNVFGGMHGGAFAAVAEIVAIDCARTVVGEDKDVFLAELSMSYLSASPTNAELRVDASVVRSGRNVTVIAIEFRLKDAGKLSCLSRATFYNTPVAKL